MNWDNASYQKIKDAKFSKDRIIISFENEDIIEVLKESLIPHGIKDIEWEKITFNPFDITIPAKHNSIQIPWDKLRVLTDSEFAKHLAGLAEKQAKMIGSKIKRLRQKKGIKSNELAKRTGITPQTISRIEQGHTDLGFTTLRKILAAMGYSLKDLANQEIQFEMENKDRSFDFLLKRLRSAGIDTNLVSDKIIPTKLKTALNSFEEEQPDLLLDEAASYISNIYGWTINEIWTNQNLVIEKQPATMAYFKKPSKANEKQIQAYSHYAYYLAKVVLKAYPAKSEKIYPESIEDFKKQYMNKYKSIDLESLLNFVWELGVCVLPLDDSGVFHGAAWNIYGRHVIILKQKTSSHARWIFDLLHELYHVFAHLENENTSVIEIEELNPFSNTESIEELEANSFANQFIFGNKVEKLAENSVELANWKIENLKKAVLKVAKKERIREDFLSNYLAFRLSHQGENWWSSAAKMQITEPDPFSLTANLLKKKIQLQMLNPMDYNLLNTATKN